jgi:hypothetical protein
VYFDGDPNPDLTVDLFGDPTRLAAGTNLGDGWWYLHPERPAASSQHNLDRP